MVDFKGERRTNQTHQSSTDPEAKLMRRGNGQPAKLCFGGHALMENRSGLCADLKISDSRTSEPRVAQQLLTRLRRSRTPLALCIGTIGARKNQALLVRALAADDNVSAVFIGDGDAAPLLRLAGELGVTERVRVLGYRADASRYLAHADVLVLPSMNEGLPIAVLEALRAGVPVVGSAIPEIAEAVADGKTGVLFEPGHVTALASALRRALAPESHTAMRVEARAAFEATYLADRMLAGYGRLYADVLRRSAS